jgi:2-amino-4-hydroxy-6-hydroxymethyldihydropteridine diphosphokinase
MVLNEIAPDEAIVVALGSNRSGAFGSPADMVERALDAFGDNNIMVRARSSLWRSRAWPDPAGGDFINAVAVVETTLEPGPLLAVLHGIERAFGRRRQEPNAPRTLDLDLIAYGRRISSHAPILPHPRAADRGFVMGPLAEVLPMWRHPVSGLAAADLALRSTVGKDAVVLGRT